MAERVKSVLKKVKLVFGSSKRIKRLMRQGFDIMLPAKGVKDDLLPSMM
jgi:hypothetical protein